jgi:hypothetical protein
LQAYKDVFTAGPDKQVLAAGSPKVELLHELATATSLKQTQTDVGNADLVGNIDRPTHREVGNADLVGNMGFIWPSHSSYTFVANVCLQCWDSFET